MLHEPKEPEKDLFFNLMYVVWLLFHMLLWNKIEFYT